MRILGRLDLDPTRMAVMQRCGRVSEATSLEGQFRACVARMAEPEDQFGPGHAPVFRNADGSITLSAEQVPVPHFGAFPPDHEAFRHCLMAIRASVPCYVAH